MSISPPANSSPPARVFSPLHGLLSYLVPGLGQVCQGRIAKGLLFCVALYGLFFYGMYLGQWQNVYVDYTETREVRQRTSMIENLLQKARFAGQFWIGIAAWPALAQYFSIDANQRPRPEEDRHPWLGRFQRKPSEEEINTQLRNADKHPDLGWIYTVIAGVLNILVIYDAFAGPAFVAAAAKPPETARPQEEVAVT